MVSILIINRISCENVCFIGALVPHEFENVIQRLSSSMTPGACFHHRTKAAVCLAALALTPSAAWSQSVRGSLASEGDQLAQQAGAYSGQPVYLEAEASPVGQDDLVQPLYASPQLGAGEFPDDAFFAPGSFFDDTQGGKRTGRWPHDSARRRPQQRPDQRRTGQPRHPGRRGDHRAGAGAGPPAERRHGRQ